MRHLILLRHAKSSWKHTGLTDHDRPLNGRGRASAPVMAAWLADQGLHPDRILCSTSVRTQETVELMRVVSPDLPEPVLDGALYHAEAPVMLAAIRSLPETSRTAMVVAHEPGTGLLTKMLAAPGTSDACARAFSHFPTCGAAVFEVPGETWGSVRPGSLPFVAYAQPRDLMAG